MKKEWVTTDDAEIQRIIRHYYEQLYDNEMGNLEEISKFLGKYNLPRLNQEEIRNYETDQSQALKLKLIQNLPQKQKPRARWLHR